MAGTTTLSEGARPELSERARSWLAASCLLFATVLGWAELVLPPRWNTALGLSCAGLAVLHVVTASTALLAPALVMRVLRVLAWASLALALIFVGALGGASVELTQMYGALGWGLSALLGAILVLLLAITVPVGLWGLWVTRGSL